MFNAEGYISDALDSALTQDLPSEEYEILAVDDHSDDRTVVITGEYVSKYPGTVRLLENPGKGVSEARNFGIDRAVGTYILFLDADDLLEPRVLGSVYAAMEEGNLDMLAMTYTMTRDEGPKYKTRNILRIEENDREIVTGRDFIIRGRYRGIVWMYAYRREFVLGSGVSMLPLRHEDENFIPRILARASRVSYAPIELYVYRLQGSSFMNSYRPGNLFDLLEAIADMRDDIVTAYPHDLVLCKTIEERAAAFTVAAIKRAIRDRFGNEREVIEEARNKSLLPVRNSKGSLMRFLLNHFPGAFIRVYRMTAKKREYMR